MSNAFVENRDDRIFKHEKKPYLWRYCLMSNSVDHVVLNNTINVFSLSSNNTDN